MARANLIKNSFNAGEISPYTLARSDYPKYRDGCESLQNYICLTTGGLVRRPGMRFVPVKSRDEQAALMLLKVRDLLVITKLVTVFDVKDDEAAAVSSFA